jgi:hypothetical protein
LAAPLRSLVLAFALALAPATLAQAHSGAPPAGADSGIAIASITHGQMQGLAGFSGEVLALAARQPVQDAAFQRVLNHARLQRAWCAWGLMPGAVSDEASPFNACSHAYLAATRDLILRMAAQPDRTAAVDDLVRRVEAAMLGNAAALELCGFSDTAFNTAALLVPDWAAVTGHPASLLALAALALALAALAGLAARLVRGRPVSPRVRG